MFIGIFFYAICIILELTHNQFIFNKLQGFDAKKDADKIQGKTYTDIKKMQENMVGDKVLSMGIAIVVRNTHSFNQIILNFAFS